MADYDAFSDPDLLTPPLKRAAYSDRMSLMMAELSMLAYIPFEMPKEDNLLELIKKIREAER